jgi:tetratricopeptide (TPR) repeat protein
VLFLARNNQPDAALDAYAEAQRRGIDAPNVYWARGLALIGRGDITGARRDFAHLASLNGFNRHLGLLQEARLLLFESRVAEAIPRLREAAEVMRRDRNASLEFVARVQLARALILDKEKAAAREELSHLDRLTVAPTSRPNALRDAGSVALAAGQAAPARDYLKRLEAMPATTVRDAARLFLAADLALHEERFAQAAKLAEESFARRPFHGCARVRARAAEAADDWKTAADAWSAFLSLRGQIIQDGFTPDLKVAATELARARTRVNNADTRKDRR